MWNREESRSATGNTDRPSVVPAPQDRRLSEVKETLVVNVGRSVFVKGELTGSEDVTVDGRVEGRIDLPDHALTIGPNAHIQADIVAKVLTVFGLVVGGIRAGDKVDIRRGGSLQGDLACARLSIQDGAHFCGKVDMATRQPPQGEVEAKNTTPTLVETENATPALYATG
jgi:cytoskeletal protein CcmA (bactofilin family)